MRGTQHLHFGVVTSAALAGCLTFSGVASPLEAVPFIVLGGIGSLFPDIDTPESKFGRKHPYISTFINSKFGHRTITHAVLPWIAVAILSIIFLPTWMWGFSFGVLGHLFLDAFTIYGVPLGYKKKKKDESEKERKEKNIHLLPKCLRCKSGGFVSILYTFLAGMSSVLLIGMIWIYATGAYM